MTTQPANPATSQHTQPIARGFALYVGIDATQAAEHGTSLSQIAAALRKTLEELVPGSGTQTHAAVALAPKESGGRNIDVVRAALRDPELSAKVPSIDGLAPPPPTGQQHSSSMLMSTVTFRSRTLLKLARSTIRTEQFLKFLYGFLGEELRPQ